MVLAVTTVTIALWCTQSLTKDIFGDMGLVALLPVVIFFGCAALCSCAFAGRSSAGAVVCVRGAPVSTPPSMPG